MSTETSDKESADVNEVNEVPQILRWKNRRRMAWSSLTSMMILTGVLLFAPISIDRLKTLSNIVEWYYISMSSVIAAYMGFTSWTSKGIQK